MTPLVSIKFGSHLYGTSTPESDLDLKYVYLPSAEDILQQNVAKTRGVISSTTKADPLAKNGAGDIDCEMFSLIKYLAMVSEGQTVALDMLFAPEWSYTTEPHELWTYLRKNRQRLLTKQCKSFVGYCRDQANKYGIKGTRVAAARSALDLLTWAEKEYGTTIRLGDIHLQIAVLVDKTEHMSIVPLPTLLGNLIDYWEVCGRKMPFTASIKDMRLIMERVVNEYGKRALAAESNAGIDWKALSHAIRIGQQAIELLTTSEVVFPRPNADYLLSIKQGKHDYKEVASEIEDLLAKVEDAAAKSTLPTQLDTVWINRLIHHWHERVVLNNSFLFRHITGS